MVLGLVALLGLYGIRWTATGSPVPSTRANVPILILLGMTAVGFVVTSAPDLAVLTAGQVLASVSLFYITFEKIHRSVDLWRAVAVLVVLGTLFALVAPFTVQWTTDKGLNFAALNEAALPRLPKETNSNILAGAIVLIIPMSLAILTRRESRWRLLGIVSLVLMALTLILLQSRGAFFALGSGLALWASLHQKWVLPVVPLLLVGGLLFNNWAGGASLSQFLYGETSGPPTTFVQRQDLWVQGIYLVRQSPLVGIGLGAFPRVSSVAWPYTPEDPGPQRNHAHNLFLQIALDTGIAGLGAFVVLLGLAVSSMWKAYRSHGERSLAIALLSAFAVLVVHGMGDTIVWGTAKSSIVMWILLAMAQRLDKVSEIG
jgi:putative inorganic carbon (HCO3(-)) transporter